MDGRFDRVLFVRHLAICAGAVMAYVLRAELQIGYTALWIVATVGPWIDGASRGKAPNSPRAACSAKASVIGWLPLE